MHVPSDIYLIRIWSAVRVLLVRLPSNTNLHCYRTQTHNVKLNDVAKEAGKAARVEARGARLLNSSGALCLLLQLLPDKHAKQHCVVVANAQLSAEEGHPDVQALEAALLLKELQVRPAAVVRLGESVMLTAIETRKPQSETGAVPAMQLCLCV